MSVVNRTHVAAQALAQDGLAVFPCRLDKKPATPHGYHDATSKTREVERLWRLYPGPLIGLPTGARTAFAVLDIDPRHGGDVWLNANRSWLPKTLVVGTRSGGEHWYFRHQLGLRNSAGLIAAGVDVRADGGYVVHWPSAGLPILINAPVEPWPERLTAALTVCSYELPAWSEPRFHKFHREALAGLVRLVASASEGRRNVLLFWAACRVAQAPQRDFAESVLIEAARRAGLPSTEARRTVHSAFRRSQK